MLNYRTRQILGFIVLDSPIVELYALMYCSYGKNVINTISPNSYGIAQYDLSFKEALFGSILVLDGVYFSLPTIFKGKGWVTSNQGPHITKKAFEFANENYLKVFFLGSTESTLLKITERIGKEYPNISVGCYSPPFKSELDENDNKIIFDHINSFEPYFLIIGMTCPKQEKWIHKNKDFINFKVSLAVGGVFDWYAGNYKEIPQIWWDLKLGWLYRNFQRPELIRRNYKNIIIFFKDVIKELIKVEK